LPPTLPIDAGHGVTRRQGAQWRHRKEPTMKLLTDLLSTDYGLMSAAVIAITLCMAVWFSAFFRRKMNESPQPPKD
jgi:hypothetical protein